MFKFLILVLFTFLSFSCQAKEKKVQVVAALEEEQIKKKPYSELKQETLDKRAEFQAAYNQANGTERDSILFEAQN